MFYNKKSIIFILFTLVLCSTLKNGQTQEIKRGKWNKKIIVKSQYKGKSFSVPLQIYFPKNYKKSGDFRTLILLHDFNQSLREWEIKSQVERYASTYNFVLVCPAMQTSVYETKFFPETSKKWKPMPGGLWINNVLIPFLKDKYSLCTDKNKTAIMGAANGAHGAILCAANGTDLYGAAVGISGYYDNKTMKRYHPLKYIYGPYKKFSKRWENTDNVIKLAKNLKGIPIFLYHGAKESRIPYQQSLLMAIKINSLRKKNPGDYKIKHKVRKYGTYDWSDWNRSLKNIFKFLDEELD